MTTEFIMLIIFSLFIAGGISKGPLKAFKDSSLYLGARLEAHIETGNGFVEASQNSVEAISWSN